jgi:hypothetical protein
MKPRTNRFPHWHRVTATAKLRTIHNLEEPWNFTDFPAVDVEEVVVLGISEDNLSPYISKRLRRTPLVHPKPSWTEYSPEPPGMPTFVEQRRVRLCLFHYQGCCWDRCPSKREARQFRDWPGIVRTKANFDPWAITGSVYYAAYTTDVDSARWSPIQVSTKLIIILTSIIKATGILPLWHDIVAEAKYGTYKI